jgi:integrase
MCRRLAPAPARHRQNTSDLCRECSPLVTLGRLCPPSNGPTTAQQPRGRQRFLTHDEVAKLAAECPEPYDVLVTFLAYTGLRFGEIAALRVQDVDLGRRRVHVGANLVELRGGELVRGTPKTHRARSVPFPRFLAGQLAALVEGRPWDAPVFTTASGSLLRNSNFRHHVFDKAVQAAGLAPLTPHDLRDPAASLAIASGASVKAVQRMLGHTSAAMTLDVYAGLFDDELDGVADRMHAASGREDENHGAADQVRTEGATPGQHNGPTPGGEGR